MNKSINTPDNWKEVVVQLKEAFDRSGMTQDELSDKTGLLQTSISRIFSMKFVPKISTLVLIADALNCEIKVADREE